MRPGTLFFLPRGEPEGNWASSREAVMTAAVTCFGFQVLFLFSVLLTLFSTFHGSPLTLASWAQHIPSALHRAAAPMMEGSLQLGLCQEAPDSVPAARRIHNACWKECFPGFLQRTF